MRKFIVYTRAVPGCCKISDAPTIIEVEGQVVSAQEDIAVQWLPEGEFKFRIDKPEFLQETKEIVNSDGSREKIAVAPVYYSHSVYLTIDAARAATEKIVRQSLEFIQRKSKGETFTEESLKARIAEITEILLDR